MSTEPLPGRRLLSADEIAERVAMLGKEIATDYDGRDPLLIGVLRGAFVFLADLARAIPFSVELDFITVSSYGSSTRTSGVVRMVKDLDADLSGRHIVLVEDIVDSGLTLSFLRRNLLVRNPASVEICALLVRDSLSDEERASVRYAGFTVPGDWLVGYGLDAAGRWRNLPDIRTLH